MSTAITSPTITLLYETPADSRRVNTRFHNVRQVGIYDGFYLEQVSGSSFTLSGGVCEIADYSDEDYQVKIATSSDTAITVTASQYVVIRWTYTGDETADVPYAVSVATPNENELVVAYIDGSYNVDYDDGSYPRSVPNTHDMYLKVVPSDFAASYNKLRVHSGKISFPSGSIDVSDQLTSDVIDDPASGTSRIDLVYIKDDGIAYVLKGTDSASPSVPSYGDRTVLAEVTVAHGFSSITQSNIKDVRSFISMSLLDEDDFASDSATRGATQQSIKNYTKNYIGWNYDGVTTTTTTLGNQWVSWDLSSVVGNEKSLLFIHAYLPGGVGEIDFMPNGENTAEYGVPAANAGSGTAKAYGNGLILVHTTNGIVDYYGNLSTGWVLTLICYSKLHT